MSALGEKLKNEWRNLRNYRVLLFLAILGYLPVCIWKDWVNTQSLRTSTIVGNTAYVGQAIPAMHDTETHIALAKKAATAIFSRLPVETDDKDKDPLNVAKIPSNFPFREDLVRITNLEMQLQIKKNWEDNAQVFREQNVTQYFFPSRGVVEQISGPDLVTMVLDGDLFTNRTIPGGKPRLDTDPTRVTMNLRLNTTLPDRYPFVVVGILTEKLK